MFTCQKTIGGALLLSSVLLISPAAKATKQTYNANGHCYDRLPTAVYWLAAEAQCEALGGYLVTLTSQDENDFVYTNLIHTAPDSGWGGATDVAQEGTWAWITGEAWGYTNWASGEPNNQSNEDYLSLSKQFGAWNDHQPNSAKFPVCEWEPVAEQCVDGVDNDCDDLVDSNDPDCPNYSPIRTSTFDMSTEGWSTGNDATNFIWSGTTGNPPGSIHAADQGTGATWYFVAPPLYLGNLTAYHGGLLGYELRVSANDGSAAGTPDVILNGGGLQLRWFAASPIPNAWSRYHIPIAAGGWRKTNGQFPSTLEFQSALGNVTSIWIRGEFKSGADNAYFDNAILQPTCGNAGSVVSYAAGGATTDTSATNLLGVPDGVDVSLGYGGVVTVALSVAVLDGPGIDLVVHEIGASDPGDAQSENIHLEASSDGRSFLSVGTCVGDECGFDLAVVGLAQAQVLRITDLLPNETGSPNGGADIDAVSIVHCNEQLDTVDNDGDGVSEAQGDCDDSSAAVYPGAPETCDGLNNDCDEANLDGADEVWLGETCDGPDPDLCPEGLYECIAGAQSCTDFTSDNLEVCDGLDNDCNGTKDEADDNLDQQADTDGDGLTDWEEVHGITGTPGAPPDLLIQNAPYNASCHVPDVFVEVDYMSCYVAGGDCRFPHSHKPQAAALKDVEAVFNARGGIHLHLIVDEPVAHVANMSGGLSDLDQYYNAHLGRQGDSQLLLQAKRRALRYALIVHDIESPTDVFAGLAFQPEQSQCASKGFMIAENNIWNLTSTPIPWIWASEFHDLLAMKIMHELGHTLGLSHGGSPDNDKNCKPNYLSVMNYSRSHNAKGKSWKIPGINDGTDIRLGSLDDLLDYSTEVLPPPAGGNPGSLIEDALDESLPSGIGSTSPGRTAYCAGVSTETPPRCTNVLIGPTKSQVDWNGDGVMQGLVVGNINFLPTVDCDDATAHEELKGFSDWSRIKGDPEQVPPVSGCIALPTSSATRALDGTNFPSEQSAAHYLNGLLGGEDVDADGVVNIEDNCFLDANAGQTNTDSDAYGDACDCLPIDGENWKAPSEVQELRFDGGALLTWIAPGFLGATAVRYDVLRSTNPMGFVASVQCIESDDGTDNVAIDLDVPSVGEIYYYLVRAESACPQGLGPLGYDSTGALTPGTDCQ